MAVPAPWGIRLAWGVAVTPVAGFLGFMIVVFLVAAIMAPMGPAVPPHPPPPPTPWLENLAAIPAAAFLGSLFAWPVTVVVFPLVRGRFWERNWKAFWILALSAVVAGFPAPFLVGVLITALQGKLGTLLPLDRFDPLGFAMFGMTGSISGLLVAIPYFFLTRPWQSLPWTRVSEPQPPGQL